jgi:hypothetical protein
MGFIFHNLSRIMLQKLSGTYSQSPPQAHDIVWLKDDGGVLAALIKTGQSRMAGKMKAAFRSKFLRSLLRDIYIHHSSFPKKLRE